MSRFHVVTSIKEIAALNAELHARLSKAFKHKEMRQIASPAGQFTGSVLFERSSGTGVRAWAPGKASGKLRNLLLVGEPKSRASMEIEVQVNFPSHEYNRRIAGAFVTDENNNVFLAHRGKLTRGRSGLPKEKVFREFASRVISADDGTLTSQLILIGELHDKNLPNRLWDFAEDAREVATAIGNELREGMVAVEQQPASARSSTRNSNAKQKQLKRMAKLRGYFDEHAGEGTYSGHNGGKRVVEHGDIVRALERAVRNRGLTQKSQAIDLAVVADAKADLFEVKTSSRTTDVYTGVGQLMIHGGALSELLNMEVERILVLPEEPKAAHDRQVLRCGLKVVTFKRTAAGYRFVGL